MSSLAYILREAGLVLAGAVVCYLLLWWKNRTLKEAKLRAAETILENARNQAEGILRDARLAASAEALKLREETEAALVARRAEGAEWEKRLAERETLINSQLQRLVENEAALKERKDQLARRGDVLDGLEQDVENRLRQAREYLDSPDDALNFCDSFTHRVKRHAPCHSHADSPREYCSRCSDQSAAIQFAIVRAASRQ